MTALKKNDCRQRLRDQCKHIAETISTPLEDVHEWMDENQYKIFLDQLLNAKKFILNNYVERVFEK